MERFGWCGRYLRTNHTWLIVGAAVLAVTMFRFSIAAYSLWFDEQASMFFVQQPMGRLWSSWMVREPNPPLYYSLLKYWIDLFGDSERAVRALSIMAGAGAIGAIALFTARIYGRKAGIIAAILTALSTQQLYYTLQVRSYELAFIASSGALISLVSIDRSLRLGRAWTGSLLGYACGCTIAIYLHTTMFLLPVICTLSIIAVRRHEWMQKPALLLPLMAANLATALAAGWWLDITVRQMISGAEDFTVFDAVTPWLIIKKTVGTLFLVRNTGAGFTPIAMIFLLVAIVQARRNWLNPDTRLLVTTLGISIGMLSLISIEVPIYLPRTIFWLSIITTALCAAGITSIHGQPAQRWAIAGLGALVALNMATSVATRQQEDWNGAIVRAENLPGSRLIVESEAMGLLLKTACDRLNHDRCPVPIIAVTSRDDRMDRWSFGEYSGPSIAIEHLGVLPSGQYFVFRKGVYHDLLKMLHLRGKGSSLRDDPPLLGPVDRSALIG